MATMDSHFPSGLLVVRVNPDQFESLRGYMLRLAALNLNDRLFRSYLSSPADACRAIPRLARLTGLPFRALADMMFFARCTPASGECARIHELGFEVDALCGSRRRFCPACMQRDRISRASWELKMVTGCSLHACQLEDVCPGCRCDLTWINSTLTHCNCGQALGEAIPRRVGRYTVLRNLLIEEALVRTNAGVETMIDMGLEQAWQVDPDWLLLLIDFIEKVMIPRELGNRTAEMRARAPEKLAATLLAILEDRRYYWSLRRHLFLRMAQEPMKLAESMLPGKRVGDLLASFEPILQEIPRHPALQALSQADLPRSRRRGARDTARRGLQSAPTSKPGRPGRRDGSPRQAGA